MDAYLNAHNGSPGAVVWSATAEQIRAEVRLGRVALQ